MPESDVAERSLAQRLTIGVSPAYDGSLPGQEWIRQPHESVSPPTAAPMREPGHRCAIILPCQETFVDSFDPIPFQRFSRRP